MLPEFLQGEQVGGVLGVVEDVGGGLVDRHGARAGGRVGRLAGVQGEGLEALEGVLRALVQFSHLVSVSFR